MRKTFLLLFFFSMYMCPQKLSLLFVNLSVGIYCVKYCSAVGIAWGLLPLMALISLVEPSKQCSCTSVLAQTFLPVHTPPPSPMPTPFMGGGWNDLTVLPSMFYTLNSVHGQKGVTLTFHHFFAVTNSPHIMYI
jgi:hypothetical protein